MPFEAANFLADLFRPASRLRPENLSEDFRVDYEERAGIAEFCGNMPRREAERQAWAEVVTAQQKRSSLGR